MHVNLRAINPCRCVRRSLSIPIDVPVMFPYSVKIFAGYEAFENGAVLTL